MVDIGLEGIKFEKGDLCNKLSDEILKNNKILDGLIDKGKGYALESAKEKLGELTGLGNGALSDPQDAIDGATSDANTASDAATSMKDKVLGGKPVNGSDVSLKTIADCLGGGLPNFGFPDAESPIDLEQLGKIAEELANALLKKLGDAISSVLSPLENAISDAIGMLTDLIPLDLIDQLLGIVQCIEDCPNVDHSKMPTLLDIEDKISSVGLKITGEIDWDSGVWGSAGSITDEMKEHFNKISEAKTQLMETTSSVKGVKLPEVPAIPTIPRPPNPLDGISLKEKIESLF